SSRGEARHRLVGDDGSTGCGVPTAWRDGEARRTPAVLQRTVDLDTHGRTGLSTGDALVVAALAIAACDWVAVARGAKGAEYVCNPLALTRRTAGAAASGRPPLPESRWAFTVAALCLSLAGDVFLMLPKDLFVAGLGSFLLAHLAYVAAFNTSPPP